MTTSTLQLRKEYVAELYPIRIDDKTIHAKGTGIIAKYYRDWKLDTREKPSFEEHMRVLLNSPFYPQLKLKLLSQKVRYFGDKERIQTVVTFTKGRLYQIGLDSKDKSQKLMGKKKYLWVIAKSKKGKKTLYAADLALKKIKRSASLGVVQHSSFMAGKEVISAGNMTLNKKGRITWVVLLSGHYKPGQSELSKCTKFLKNKIPERHFNFIIKLPNKYLI